MLTAAKAARLRFKEARRELKLLRLPRISSFPPARFSRPVAHVAAFQVANAGDVLLPITLKDLIHTETGSLDWRNLHVYNRVDERAIRRINGSAGLVIGGGGLFLRDTNPNAMSGWQWSCTLDALRRIDVPIAVFAVGYNRFRGQPDFDPVFTEHVNELARRSVYLGLRNHGSIDAMKEYLTPENQQKLRFQPCMTTVISRIYPRLTEYREKERFVALNAAFDRSELRFGDAIDEKLAALARVMRRLNEDWPVAYYAHMPSDLRMLPYLDAAGVRYRLVRLDQLAPADIIREYARPSLVIGMRGHAQMVPYGAETPILSVMTHDKLGFFLDDIGRPEWGVDIHAEGFEDTLHGHAVNVLGARTEHQEAIRETSETLWDRSRANVRDFLDAMGA